MTDRPLLRAASDRALAALRVIGSFLAGLGIGALLLLPVAGPIAMILMLGALIFGFPSLVVAVALRLIFWRRIARALLAWCLAAPIVAVVTLFVAQYLLDYRHRGLDPAAFLALPQNPGQAVLAAWFAAFSSIVFYLWERAAIRRSQASS